MSTIILVVGSTLSYGKNLKTNIFLDERSLLPDEQMQCLNKRKNYTYIADLLMFKNDDVRHQNGEIYETFGEID